jgi:hypothetical protein
MEKPKRITREEVEKCIKDLQSTINLVTITKERSLRLAQEFIEALQIIWEVHRDLKTAHLVENKIGRKKELAKMIQRMGRFLEGR